MIPLRTVGANAGVARRWGVADEIWGVRLSRRPTDDEPVRRGGSRLGASGCRRVGRLSRGVASRAQRTGVRDGRQRRGGRRRDRCGDQPDPHRDRRDIIRSIWRKILHTSTSFPAEGSIGALARDTTNSSFPPTAFLLRSARSVGRRRSTPSSKSGAQKERSTRASSLSLEMLSCFRTHCNGPLFRSMRWSPRTINR